VTLAEWLLFLHILFGITWVGGTIMLQVLGFRASRSSDPKQTVEFLGTADFAGRYVFNVAGILTAAFGIWLVIDSDFIGFDEAWISFALTIVIISALLGMFFFGPQAKKAMAIAEERGPEDAEFGSLMQRIMVVSQVELVLLLAVVWAMVFKPGA
jgi:uncharacterized membrane protein